VGLERDSFSLVGTIEELLGRNSGGSGIKPRIRPWGCVALTTRHPLFYELNVKIKYMKRPLHTHTHTHTQKKYYWVTRCGSKFRCPLNTEEDCASCTSCFGRSTLVRRACTWEDNEAIKKRAPSVLEHVKCYFTYIQRRSTTIIRLEYSKNLQIYFYI
jgi:hypothetical protein